MNDTGGQLPFEGSAEIAGIVAGLIRKWKVTTFVETGTQYGATALWASEKVERVITIELDGEMWHQACENLKGTTATSLRGDSTKWLNCLSLTNGENVLFFLDAHSMQGTPILEELDAIKRLVDHFGITPIICIHDIQVPGHPGLGFDHYEDGTELTLGYIYPALERNGMSDWKIRFNSTIDGAARGFCYIAPKI